MLLTEGGAAGHLQHLYDNRDLTYNELESILTKASQGSLVGTEKTDGFNIYLGYNDGRAKAVRNKTDFRNNGMDARDLMNREFKGGEGIKKIYNDAFSAFERAVQTLSPQEREILFGKDGRTFLNTEIMAGLTNVINYDRNALSIHRSGHKRYKPETDEIEVVPPEELSRISQVLDKATDRFEQALSGVDFRVQQTALQKLQGISDKSLLNDVLKRIQDAGFSGDMTIGDFMFSRIYPSVEKQLSQFPKVAEQLTNRLLGRQASNLTILKKEVGNQQEFINKISNILAQEKELLAQAIEPIENSIHDFAVELLKGVQSAYVLNQEEEVGRIRAEVADAIKAIQSYQGENKEEAWAILAKQLKKLKNIENVNTSVEGFVFQIGDQVYKFTGNFAPVNQLLGLFRYGRGNLPPLKKTELNEQLDRTGKRVIAIYPGRFHPFHKGHKSAYQSLVTKFGEDNVFIFTTGKQEQPKSPFSFEEKKQMMMLTGVPEDKIVRVNSPYNAREVLNVFSDVVPQDTILVYGISGKDMLEDPRFAFKPKVDGSPSYLQPFSENNIQTMDKYGYVFVVPTIEFYVLGKPASSASELRKQFVSLDMEQQKEFITDLFGSYDPQVHEIMINRLVNVNESQYIDEVIGLLLEMSTMGGGSVEGGVRTNVNKQKTTATTSTYSGKDIIAMVNKRLKELDNE
jgi:hypothetical protein